MDKNYEEKDEKFSTNNNNHISLQNTKLCNMNTCFYFSKHKQGFSVYVYSVEDSISPLYQKILKVITE